MYALKKIFVEATGLQTSHLGIDQAHMILLMNLGLPENKIEDTKPIPESIQTAVQSKQINQQAADDSQNQQQQDYQNNSQQLQDHHQLQQGQQQGQPIQHNQQLQQQQPGQQIPNQQNPSEQNDANIQTVISIIFSIENLWVFSYGMEN